MFLLGDTTLSWPLEPISDDVMVERNFTPACRLMLKYSSSNPTQDTIFFTYILSGSYSRPISDNFST